MLNRDQDVEEVTDVLVVQRHLPACVAGALLVYVSLFSFEADIHRDGVLLATEVPRDEEQVPRTVGGERLLGVLRREGAQLQRRLLDLFGQHLPQCRLLGVHEGCTSVSIAHDGRIPVFQRPQYLADVIHLAFPVSQRPITERQDRIFT